MKKFTYLFNFVVAFNSSSFFVLPQFKIPNSHTVASILSIDISRNYLFNPQLAISFNRNTNSFLVGRVIITYPAPRNEALISHWIASFVDDLLSEFTACQGCASAIPRSSTSKTLIKRCPSEKCFSYVPLSNLIRYAKSLLLFHLFAPVRSLPMNNQVSRMSDIQLPFSVSTLYIDGSFLPISSHSLHSMAYAWTAIDSDGFILESHYNIISSLFSSALRSEIFALLHGLDSLPRNSKITVATDCAQLISLWFTYVDVPFIPRMLKESNYLLWSLARAITSQKNLEVTFIKVPAHADDSLNNHVDALAKAAHIDSHLPSRPLSELLAPCILQFNSLPVDMNIQKFIRDIFDAKSLLTLAVLPRFNSIFSTSEIDWACTKFCLNNNKQFVSHRNGRSKFCAFRIKILLDMLPTLTTLQKQKPHIYDPSWPCPQCNFSPETLNHLWTCPYILPEFSPFNTFKTLLLELRTVCLEKFLSATPLIPLPDSFVAEFTALDCWECDFPSSSCLRLARGLIPISLTGFLGLYFSSSVIWSILDTPLHDFHFDLYVQIWLCRSVFFHHWESAQGITNKMKSSVIGPSPISYSSSQISPDFLTPSLATFSLYLGFLFGNELDLKTCWIVDLHWPSGKVGVCVSVIV
ncbi:ribonuclease H-like domain-containing protein [Rhizophagus irregularis DAOM 181602=DAOM 197198]|nr:ribonuclease H-like domain-containing protein [Rhizophagus irregularis DAOM 181602=DAOM 197198]